MQHRVPQSPSSSSTAASFTASTHQSGLHHSNNPPFPPLSSQQAPTGQLPNRARIASSASNQTPPSAAGLPASQGGVSASGGGGGGVPSRVARASPASSQPQTTSVSAASAPSSSAGQPSKSISQILLTQVYVILGRLNTEKDPAQREAFAEQIANSLASSGMEVFPKYFRRLLQQNAGYIFNDGATPPGSYDILRADVEKIRMDPQEADKIAESIDSTEGDLFRNFDVSKFMDHFKLDPVAKTMLALSLKNASKPDLRTKADAILSSVYPNLLMTILRPTSETGDDLPTHYLFTLLDRFIRDPPRNWTDENKNDLQFSVKSRYEALGLPEPINILTVLQLANILISNNPVIKLLQRAGPRTTLNLDECKEILVQLDARDATYNNVADALLFMVLSQDLDQLYDPAIFVQTLKDHRSGKRLDWQDVVGSFDRDKLIITKRQFLELYKALLPLAQEYENFDIQMLWGGQWTHLDTQLWFVVDFLSCTPDELDASTIPRLRKAYSQEDFEDASEEVRLYAQQAVRLPFVSLDAVKALFNKVFRSKESYVQAISMKIPETIINPHTDLFVLATGAIREEWGNLQSTAFMQLFTPFLRKRIIGDDFVLHGLTKRSPEFLFKRLDAAFKAEPTDAVYIYEQAKKHGWLPTLTTIPTEFGVEMAAMSHRDGDLDLDSWLEQMMMSEVGEVFPQALARILDTKARADIEMQRNGTIIMVSLSLKTVSGFLRFLENTLPEDTFLLLLKQCITAYPRLINYGQDVDEVLEANSRESHALSPDADRIMHEHFKKLYSGESKVRDVIETLQRLKQSEEPGDQELFASMIGNLFTEYHYFSEYPLEALSTTAVLFGGVINFNLLSSHALQVGLSMVLEAVQTSDSPENKVFKFGLQALKQFQSRLPEWPTFCERLLRAPLLKPTEIWKIAEEVIRSQGGSTEEPPAIPHGITNGTNEAYGDALDAFTCIHPGPALRNEIYEIPTEDVKDKVLFLLNNVSPGNVEEKSVELKDVLEDRHHQWFAEYLVDQRAKTQANFQNLYLAMLDVLGDRLLWQEVLRETFVSIGRLLNAEGTMNSTSEKSHLKSLGTWLGSITLARDIPIKLQHLSFKDLIIEAHSKQRLPIVIPFTSKVLTEATKSELFLPPNPWTVEILRLLLEVYCHTELRINLKFEIETLCGNLKFDIKTEPSTYLRDRLALQSLEEFNPVMVEEMDPEPFHDMTLLRSRATRGSFSPSTVVDNLPDISTRLMYPPHTSTTVPSEQLRQVFAQAAQQAIQEIIFPVVERSVTIAAISAYQLVVKDFATEPDEAKVRSAAHNMVKRLAGSLAMVTCREPLRMSMSNNVRGVAQKIPDSIPEGSILMFVNDNIDVVCRVIEEAAERHSIPEIDSSLREWFQQRSSGQLEEPLVNRYAYAIPEPFKPTPGGLRPEQLAIYDHFGSSGPAHIHTPTQDARQQLPEALQEQFGGIPGLPSAEAAPIRQTVQQRMITNQPMMGNQTQLNGFGSPMSFLDRVEGLLNDLSRLTREATEEHIGQLGKTSPVREVYERLIHIIETQPRRDVLAAFLADKALSELFQRLDRSLDIEVFCQLLQHLCQYSFETARYIYTTLANVQDEQLLHPILLISLLRTRLVDVHRADSVLARFLLQKDTASLQCFGILVDDLLLNDNPQAIRTTFAGAFDALLQWVYGEPEFEPAKSLINKLRLPEQAIISVTKLDEIEQIFDEWLQVYRPDVSEKIIVSFINQLQKREMFKSANDAAHFVRGCMELSILAYEQEEAAPFGGSVDQAYLYVDALSSLIVALTTYYSDPQSEDESNSRGRFFESLLSALVLHQVHHIKHRGDQMNQKVYFRLWSSLLSEVQHVLSPNVSHIDLFNRLAFAFLALSPCYVPGFAFGWLALISHRIFIPAMLNMGNEQSIDMYLHLLQNMFDTIRDLPAAIQQSTVPEFGLYLQQFHNGIMKIMVILHHDFPDFLAENHFRLCNAVSDDQVQIKNLIISAVPSSVSRLEEPFLSKQLGEFEGMHDVPVVHQDFLVMLTEAKMIPLIDSFLESETFHPADLSRLVKIIQESQSPSGMFKVPKDYHLRALIHAVVLYLGVKGTISGATEAQTNNCMKLVQRLGLEFAKAESEQDLTRGYTEALVNQLRYPNAHTLFFLSVLLNLCVSQTSGQDEDFDGTCLIELLTRSVVERLVVHRPHAWGVIAAFMEMNKIGEGVLWEQGFVKDIPEVQQMINQLNVNFHTPVPRTPMTN